MRIFATKIFLIFLLFTGIHGQREKSGRRGNGIVKTPRMRNDLYAARPYIPDEDFPTSFIRLSQLMEDLNLSVKGIIKRMEILETQANNTVKELEQIKKWIDFNSTSEIFLPDKPKDLRIVSLVGSPHARLFVGENFTGKFEDYNFENSTFKGGCHNLGEIAGNITSIDAGKKCVRVFEGSDCQGWSMAIYPKGKLPPKNFTIDPKIKGVNSVGPCLTEEFQNSTFLDKTGGNIIKNAEDTFPDLAQFFSLEKSHESTPPQNSSSSVDLYKVGGPRGRVEFIHAMIYPKHLKTTDFGIVNKLTLMGKHEGDLEGQGVPLTLGGPVNETWNYFPQTPGGKEEWSKFTSKISLYLKTGTRYVELALNFIYEGVEKSRPIEFYYWIKYGAPDVRNEICYGRIRNN